VDVNVMVEERVCQRGCGCGCRV